MELDRTDDAVIGGCHLGTDVTAIVQRIVASRGHASYHALGDIVVYRQDPVLEEGRQFLPEVLEIIECSGQITSPFTSEETLPEAP